MPEPDTPESEPSRGQLAAGVVPTKYWHALPDGRIQCDVCPRYCQLHEGQRGLFFVRANQQRQIVLTTYGRSSGFCVDPSAARAARESSMLRRAHGERPACLCA